eukprot:303775-Amphidinium_carterae.2
MRAVVRKDLPERTNSIIVHAGSTSGQTRKMVSSSSPDAEEDRVLLRVVAWVTSHGCSSWSNLDRQFLADTTLFRLWRRSPIQGSTNVSPGVIVTDLAHTLRCETCQQLCPIALCLS